MDKFNCEVNLLDYCGINHFGWLIKATLQRQWLRAMYTPMWFTDRRTRTFAIKLGNEA